MDVELLDAKLPDPSRAQFLLQSQAHERVENLLIRLLFHDSFTNRVLVVPQLRPPPVRAGLGLGLRVYFVGHACSKNVSYCSIGNGARKTGTYLVCNRKQSRNMTGTYPALNRN